MQSAELFASDRPRTLIDMNYGDATTRRSERDIIAEDLIQTEEMLRQEWALLKVYEQVVPT